jgi:hypothetical protein
MGDNKMKMMYKFFIIPAALLLILVLVRFSLVDQKGVNKLSKSDFIQKTKKIQIPFITNNGQTDKRVKYYANTFGGTVFLTNDAEIVYSLPSSKDEGANTHSSLKTSDGSESYRFLFNKLRIGRFDAWCFSPVPCLLTQASGLDDSRRTSSAAMSEKRMTRCVILKEEIIGGKANKLEGEKEAVTKVSDFRGKDKAKWKAGIPTYEMVNFGEMYEGIELKLKAYGSSVEKLFYVHPDANPGAIKIKLSGAKALKVNEKGQLEAETELGIVKFSRPVAYQEIKGKRIEIAVEYRIQNSEFRIQNVETNLLNPQSEIQNPKSEELLSEVPHSQLIYGFKVAAYDKTKELIIDPIFLSTFLGGFSYDDAHAIVIDKGGNIYVTGETWSSDFPATAGAYNTSFHSADTQDAFLSQFDEDLTTLLASTYLGGSDYDYGRSIAIDPDGNIYVTGVTWSSDFPITPGAYDTFINGFADAFVSKLSGDLTGLLASTYLGGSEHDFSNSIAINSSDSGGNIYVTGVTYSSDFPITLDAYDTSFNSGDAFVSRLDGNLETLLASTYLGGFSSEFGNSIAIDSGGNIYVAGETLSSDFPITPGAYDASFNGGGYFGGDTFVSKLDGGLTNLLASTFLGGDLRDEGKSIAIDTGGNVYVVGSTESANFPTTPGAYDTSFRGYVDVVVSKLNGDLTNLLASTFLGGELREEGESIALDTGGNIYVAGFTWTSDFPITIDAYDTSPNGSFDAFISRLTGDLTKLLASTYLGGFSSDDAHSIAIDANGNIYVAGSTYSSNFPTITGVYDVSFNSDRRDDAFISKFDSNLSSGRVSRWKFDEGSGMTAKDLADGNDGTINGATWVTGIRGSGLSFDGDDSVEIPGLIGLPQDITISGWAKLISKDTTGAELISLGDYVGIRLDKQGGGTRGFYHDGTTWRPTTTGIFYAGTEWHHFVYVIDNTNNIQKFYVDGVQAGSSTHTQPISYAGLGQNTFIGKHGNGIDTYDFNGLIDDVCIYNRALSDTEVQDLYSTIYQMSHWKFDEGIGTVAKDSADGNDGTINGASWASGMSGEALSFDGFDDYVEIPGLLGQPKDITISVWANLSASDTSGGEAVSLGNYVAFRLDNIMNNGANGFYYDGTNWQSTNTGKFYAGTGWHHFAYVVDDINNIQKVYVDGIVMGSTAYTQSISYVGLGSNTFIGKHGNGISNYDFNGLIDDVRIYHRALSDREVLNLYGLVSYWKFDEGSGVTADDSVGGNDGTIIGATWTAGISGSGLSFDGDDSIEIPGLLGQPQNLTISTWVNLSDRDTSGAELISLGDYVVIRLDGTGSNGTMGFYYDGTMWKNTTTGISYAGTGWHHFAYVVDDINNIQKVYVDGIVMGSTAHTQSISYIGLGSNTFIGKHGNGVDNYNSNGIIDEIRIYNRALSDQEVQVLYNGN